MMNATETFEDYYKLLECDRNSSEDEIKKNYQRLILSCHPDKSKDSSQNFVTIQKAWLVLRDPQTRKQYDALLSCYENNEFLLYDSVMLSDMEQDSGLYLHKCRCGGTYVLEASDLLLPELIIPCDECSFSIKVHVDKR